MDPGPLSFLRNSFQNEVDRYLCARERLVGVRKPATLNAKNSVAEWSWQSHFPVASQRQEGMGVGLAGIGKTGRTQGSVAGQLDLYPGSTHVNVSNDRASCSSPSCSTRSFLRLPLVTRNTEMRHADVTEGQSCPLPNFTTEHTTWDMLRGFSLRPLLTTRTTNGFFPLKRQPPPSESVLSRRKWKILKTSQ